MFADDIRDAERRHPAPPTLAEFKIMIWRTYNAQQNVDLAANYINNVEGFGGNTSSSAEVRTCWKCGSTKHISTSKDCPKFGNKQQNNGNNDKKKSSNKTVYDYCQHCKKNYVTHSAKNCFKNKNGPNYRPPQEVQQSSLGKRKASDDTRGGGRVQAPSHYRSNKTETAASSTSNKSNKKAKIERYEDDADESVNCVHDVMVDFGEISYFASVEPTTDKSNNSIQ